MRTSIIAVAILALAASNAAANRRTDARKTFKEAKAAYKSGDYTSALGLLKRAYKLKPHPALLRFIGQTYQRLGNEQAAVEALERYLEQAPRAPDRAGVEALIEGLEEKLAKKRRKSSSGRARAGASRRAPPPGEVERLRAAGSSANKSAEAGSGPTGDDTEVPDVLQAPEGSVSVGVSPVAEVKPGSSIGWKGVTKWVGVGVTVATATLGIVFNQLAAKAASDLEGAVVSDCPGQNPSCGGNPDKNAPVVPFQKRHHDLLGKNSTFNAASIASFAIAGAAAAATITLFVLDRGKERPRSSRRALSVQPVAARGYWGAAATLSF